MTDTASFATDVNLNDEIASMLSQDPHDRPVALAYVGDDGLPHLSFRGSTHVHSPQQLAIWARKPDSGLAAAITNHPDVALLFMRPAQAFLSMTGRAHVDPSANDTVWANTPQIEKDTHPEIEGTGVAVIVDVDTVIWVDGNGMRQMTRGATS